MSTFIDGESTFLLVAERGLRWRRKPASSRCCSRQSSSGLLRGFGIESAASAPASCTDEAFTTSVPVKYRSSIGVAIAENFAGVGLLVAELAAQEDIETSSGLPR
eukprot:26136-Pyramimonas_sp.AAC.1